MILLDDVASVISISVIVAISEAKTVIVLSLKQPLVLVTRTVYVPGSLTSISN
jgi:hypothetical protein